MSVFSYIVYFSWWSIFPSLALQAHAHESRALGRLQRGLVNHPQCRFWCLRHLLADVFVVVRNELVVPFMTYHLTMSCLNLQSLFFTFELLPVLMCVTESTPLRLQRASQRSKKLLYYLMMSCLLSIFRSVYFSFYLPKMADEFYRLVAKFLAPKGKAKAKKEAVVPSDDEMPEISECVFPLYLHKSRG